jgi:hypothetical protein
MRRAWGKLAMIAVLAATLGFPGVGWGEAFAVSDFNGELGLRFGYGKSNQKASVYLYSLLPYWGTFLIRPGKSLGPVGLSFVLEGIVSVAQADGNGAEVGITPLLKARVLLFPGVFGFIEGGAGLIAESFDSPAVAHTFNFTPQVGAGVDFALRANLAATVAYRFRHSSNAALYKENPAFNCHFFHGGLTYFY